MEKLLPYFERELGFLRRSSREFSARYPTLAGQLLLNGEASADPQIEHLIQSTALLNGRIAKLLDDNYSQFTEALLELLYPHYLRPIPSYAIAHIDASRNLANAVSTVTTIARGSTLKTLCHGSQACKFRTAYEVTIAPVKISSARLVPFIDAPATVRLPPGVTCAIRIEIDSSAPLRGLERLGLQHLRVFIDGEPSLRAALLDALFLHTAGAYVEANDSHAWSVLPAVPVHSVGYAPDQALLPAAPSAHPAYQLLTEYFAFPEKQHFFDIDLAALLDAAATSGSVPCRRLSLHLVLAGLHHDSPAVRTLTALSEQHLLLSCTPVINLFSHAATPIKLTHTSSAYQLMPDQMAPAASEVYSVDRGQLLRTGPDGNASTELTPYYALRHDMPAAQRGNHWLVRRDPVQVSSQPRHELSISFIERNFDPLDCDNGSASLSLTCSNRNLPATLPYGLPDGDLQLEQGSANQPIRLLRKPSASYRLANGRGSQWGLLAHLALNHRSLTDAGLPAFSAMLRLYVQADAAVSQRQIDGIVGLQHQPGAAWLRDAHGAAYVNGIEVRVTLDEAAFVGTSIHAFAQMLDQLLGLYVHLNSYTRLVVLSHASGKELLRCPPRNGALPLV